MNEFFYEPDVKVLMLKGEKGDKGDQGVSVPAGGTAGQYLKKKTDADYDYEWANIGCPFPVGFGGFFQTDPNTIYSGTTWEQKKDVFILAAGDTYGAGSTGGEAQHTLTANEMPNHDHVERANNSYANPNALSDLVDSSNSGNSSGFTFDLNKFVAWANAVNSKTGVTQAKGIDYTDKGVKIPTSTSGGSQPHNNMPPYYAMPFWIRTA